MAQLTSQTEFLLAVRTAQRVREPGYGLNDYEIRIAYVAGGDIFIFPQRPDRLWDPPHLLSALYRWLIRLGLWNQNLNASQLNAEVKSVF